MHLLSEDNKWVIVGIGDLINTMITASIAVGIILLISHKLGSLNMIVLPIVGGAVAGLIGLLILPYTKLITLGLGDVINGLTNTQPIIMTILIAMIFYINCFTDIINWDRFGNLAFQA